MYDRQSKSKYLLLLLLLFVTVGFAVLSRNLKINGTSSISRTTWKIYWDNIQVNSGSVSGADVIQAATVTDEDKTLVEYAVTLTKPGDFYEFTVDAVNEGTIDAVVDVISNNIYEDDGSTFASLPDYLNYTISYVDNSPIELGDSLNASTTQSYKIRIEIKPETTAEELPDNPETVCFEFGVDYIQANVGYDKVGYKVIHRYPKLDDGYVEVVEELRGKPGTDVTPDIKEKEGFSSPNTQTVNIKADGTTEVVYEYTRNKYTLTLQDSEYIESNIDSGEYFYGTVVTLRAKDKAGSTFTKWSNNLTDQEITFKLKDNLTIRPIYDLESYNVKFNANGGDCEEISRDIPIGQAVGDLPEVTREHHVFAGWYTGISTGVEVDKTFVPTGDVELYARWNKIVCKRATTLHTAECERTTDGCYAAGYSANGSKGTTTITYGNIPVGNFSVGNAYDCDVNDDGEYNASNERFYYIGSRGDNAVMIFYSGFEGDAGPKNVNIFDHTTAPTMLPTTTQWSGLNVLFDGKPARFAYPSEVEASCGSDYTTKGGLDDCVFLLENSRFVSESTGRTAYWLEDANSKYYRVYTTDRYVVNPGSTSSNSVRPVIEVAVNLVDNKIDEDSLATITFKTQGGEAINPLKVIKNTQIGALPTAIKEDYVFDGWYTDTNYQTEVTASTIITGDIDVYAKWKEIEGVAVVNGVGYSTLSDAISAVPSNTKTTVKLLQDVSGSISIPSTKNVVLDLHGHTLSNSSSTVIENKGVLEIINGIVTCGAGSGAINNKSTGTLTIRDATITATGTRQAIYNDAGIVIIEDGAVLTSNTSVRATLHNLNSGTVSILGGEIISNNLYAVYNENGTLNIGEKDGISDSTSPIMRGKTYGVVANASYNFYDGIIEGLTYSVGIATTGTTPTITTDTTASKINEVDDDTELAFGEEVVGSNTYKTLTLNMLVNKYKITFNPNGGEVSPTYKKIDAGDRVGELPLPTKGIYTFVGWYTNLLNGVEIDENEIPNGNVTYYAKWIYNSSDEVVNFNMTNNPMTVYYNNIATWKNDSDNFQTTMLTNFNNYNCKCTDNTCSTSGTVLCDKPKSYDTGTGDRLNVYLYNTFTNSLGVEVSYTDSSEGIIHNMIPNQTYYWELADDHDVYGYVKAIANRRLLDVNGVRNLRDLGGLAVDTNGDGIADHTVKYGKLFRGEKPSTSQSSKNAFISLGIDEELDLRAASEVGSSEVHLDNYKLRELKHYQIDRANYPSNYNMTRSVVREAMQDIVAGNSIYFHCRIGADRTGTLAYILEGLLQVTDEERLEDYEMTFFFGLINRHRYYSTDPTSSVSKTEKFVYMYNFLTTSQDIYDWYMEGSSDIQSDQQLIEDFRAEMLVSN